jgi:hypothetical protein
MTYAEVRRVALWVFIAFLTLTAIVAIVSLLSGEFGDTEVKILVTSLTISGASICAMSCAAFIERRRSRALGIGGIVLAVLAAGLVIAGLWSGTENEHYWKVTGTAGVLAIAFAHGFLLALPELERRHRWAQLAAAASIAVLALQILVAMWAEIEDEAYFRVLAVVAVLVGFETLVIPILMRLRRGGPVARETLVLERIGNGVYRDPKGATYRVTPTDDAPLR